MWLRDKSTERLETRDTKLVLSHFDICSPFMTTKPMRLLGGNDRFHQFMDSAPENYSLDMPISFRLGQVFLTKSDVRGGRVSLTARSPATCSAGCANSMGMWIFLALR